MTCALRRHKPSATDRAPLALTQDHVTRNPDEQARVKAVGGKISNNNRCARFVLTYATLSLALPLLCSLGFCLEVTRSFGDLGMLSMGLSNDPYMYIPRSFPHADWCLSF